MRRMTVRQIPEDVERELRQLASRNETSLNQTVIAALRRGLGLTPLSNRRRDLSNLGEWTSADAAEFDRNTQVFRQIDVELWQ